MVDTHPAYVPACDVARIALGHGGHRRQPESPDGKTSALRAVVNTRVHDLDLAAWPPAGRARLAGLRTRPIAAQLERPDVEPDPGLHMGGLAPANVLRQRFVPA